MQNKILIIMLASVGGGLIVISLLFCLLWFMYRKRKREAAQKMLEEDYVFVDSSKEGKRISVKTLKKIHTTKLSAKITTDKETAEETAATTTESAPKIRQPKKKEGKKDKSKKIKAQLEIKNKDIDENNKETKAENVENENLIKSGYYFPFPHVQKPMVNKKTIDADTHVNLHDDHEDHENHDPHLTPPLQVKTFSKPRKSKSEKSERHSEISSRLRPTKVKGKDSDPLSLPQKIASADQVPKQSVIKKSAPQVVEPVVEQKQSVMKKIERKPRESVVDQQKQLMMKKIVRKSRKPACDKHKQSIVKPSTDESKSTSTPVKSEPVKKSDPLE